MYTLYHRHVAVTIALDLRSQPGNHPNPAPHERLPGAKSSDGPYTRGTSPPTQESGNTGMMGVRERKVRQQTADFLPQIPPLPDKPFDNSNHCSNTRSHWAQLVRRDRGFSRQSRRELMSRDDVSLWSERLTLCCSRYRDEKNNL
ncbi:hypothetical protein BaRGS_00020420 [Batillaria attramentaria]|uniref:Uncharacterized protein n=1 Tax=Batillaria attramentaria TaxID=370345 RepID=A0ABD0KLY7_9CAEN